MKFSGVTRVFPGSMATCSMPSATSSGHTTSANCAARIRTASDTRGTVRFAAIPRATCPRNMAGSADQKPGGRDARGDDGRSERDRELPRVKIPERVLVQVIAIPRGEANGAAVDRLIEDAALHC